MALLGSDGNGYDLARRLETCGVWRPWLGESLYANFVPYLSKPSVWDNFMRSDDSKSRAQIHLQLRVRALLFDKSCFSLFLQSSAPPPTSSSSSSVSFPSVAKLNSTYLQLHGDDVYFTLENCLPDGVRQRDSVASSISSSSKIKSKTSFSVGSRFGPSEMENSSQKFRLEDFPESWYSKFIEKYKATKPYNFSFSDRELDKRTPEEMSAYLRLGENHKRRRLASEEDQCMELKSNSIKDGHNSIINETLFFPETMFTMNCVPDTALLSTFGVEEHPKVKFYGVLDMLPLPMTRNTVMIERLGIRPEYLNTGQGGNKYNGSEGNKICLSKEQASQLSQKVIARMLPTIGFEGGTEFPVQVLSQLLGCHIGKLGRIFKVLVDSYKKQCSAIELVKMFLQLSGYSNFGALVELVKDETRNSIKQTQQIQAMQPQFHSTIRQSQQIPRQMNPQQMQHMVQSQNLTFQQQQQLERMRRRQPGNTHHHPGIDMDQGRPLVQVKLESPMELPIDNSFNNMNIIRHPQMQLRQQQQMAAAAAALSNPTNQFRQQQQMGSAQMLPQVQTPNMVGARAPPVKVEGFQELMGGDATLKLDSEGNKLTSPPPPPPSK